MLSAHSIEHYVHRIRSMPTSQSKDALLLAMGELVRKEVTADQLLGKIVDVMVDLLDADRGTIYLLDAEADELVSIAAHLPELNELRVPLSHGIAGYVGRTGRLDNSTEVEDEGRHWRKIDETTGYSTHSMLTAPIRADRQVIGVVQILNKRDGAFTETDEEQLTELAEQAAALLQQTTLPEGPTFVRRPPRRAVKPQERAAVEPLELGERFNGIVGRGVRMTEVLRLTRRVAETQATVLVRGESGTGKGLLARAIHHNSARATRPFVQVDCTTLPAGLMENELFGHERGAYTGAHQKAIGKVEAADGGTLFLDEVGDLPLPLQGKLLTLIQDHTFTPVGGTRQKEVDIRVVAATNRDLEELVEAGQFREDLYYRLKVVELEMPPLRERGREDLVRLIDHFVSRAARRHGRRVDGVDDEALEQLLGHGWPGNVRELENCIESAVIFSDGTITADVLPVPSRRVRGDGNAGTSPFSDEPTLEQLEARYIRHLLEQHDQNRSACARILGIGRNTLLRKMKAFGLE